MELGYIDPEGVYIVSATIGIFALVVTGFIIYRASDYISGCRDQLKSINQNLTGINESLRKLADGKLEQGVEQGPEH